MCCTWIPIETEKVSAMLSGIPHHPPDHTYGSTMIAVETGLYIGSVSDLKDPEALTSAGITHVLTVDSEERRLSPASTPSSSMPLNDFEPQIFFSSWTSASTFITEVPRGAAAGKPIIVGLVH
ncbi:hypothetical protein NFI96_022428, partial [Prochilodus magdalenae]